MKTGEKKQGLITLNFVLSVTSGVTLSLDYWQLSISNAYTLNAMYSVFFSAHQIYYRNEKED